MRIEINFFKIWDKFGKICGEIGEIGREFVENCGEFPKILKKGEFCGEFGKICNEL